MCIRDRDTIDVPRIFDNMDSKNRNMVRKAIKYGVTITQDSGERLEQFISIYNETMVRDAAEQYFFFEKEYYMYIIKNMVNNAVSYTHLDVYKRQKLCCLLLITLKKTVIGSKLDVSRRFYRGRKCT